MVCWAQAFCSRIIYDKVRQLAGLGNEPDQFYTYDIESINRVIKRKTEYKTSAWPEFCRLAKEFADEQDNEIEKAVIGVGEYRFDNEYTHLEIPLARWWSFCLKRSIRDIGNR